MKDALLRWDGHEIVVCVGTSLHMRGFVFKVYDDYLILRRTDGRDQYIPFHAIRYWEPQL